MINKIQISSENSVKEPEIENKYSSSDLLTKIAIAQTNAPRDNKSVLMFIV
jgi:hypothetical protein